MTAYLSQLCLYFIRSWLVLQSAKVKSLWCFQRLDVFLPQYPCSFPINCHLLNHIFVPWHVVWTVSNPHHQSTSNARLLQQKSGWRTCNKDNMCSATMETWHRIHWYNVVAIRESTSQHHFITLCFLCFFNTVGFVGLKLFQIGFIRNPFSGTSFLTLLYKYTLQSYS